MEWIWSSVRSERVEVIIFFNFSSRVVVRGRRRVDFSLPLSLSSGVCGVQHAGSSSERADARAAGARDPGAILGGDRTGVGTEPLRC